MKARLQWVLALLMAGMIFLSPKAPARENVPFHPPLSFPFFQLTLDPPHTNEAVHYIFTYELQAIHKAWDWIDIQFPAGTRFDPPIPENREESIPRLIDIMDSLSFENHLHTIGCHALQGLPMITENDDQSINFRFLLDFEMDPKEELWKTLTIHISPEAGIVTPPQSGAYSYAIRYKAFPEWQISDPIPLLGLEPGKARLEVGFPYAGMNSSYTLEYFMEQGVLDFEHPLSLLFPSNMILPQAILNTNIAINGFPPSEAYLDGVELKLYPEQAIHPGERVLIHIKKEAYFYNPPDSSALILEIKQGASKTSIFTQAVPLQEAIYPMLTLVVDPADSSTEVDFMVKIVFDEKDLPQPGESFEINLGMVGKQYHHTVDEQDSPTLLLFYSNKKVEKGFYTLKFKWKNYFLTQRYSIPFEKS